MCISASELRDIYHRFGDELSRDIYMQRMQYSIFREQKSIEQLIALCFPGYQLAHRNKVCYFGAGAGGRTMLSRRGNVPFVIDSYKKGSIEGVPIISPDEFLRMADCREYTVFMTVGKTDVRNEIAALLRQNGIRFLDCWLGTQYFDLPQLRLGQEYFVDVGALDGETTKYLMDQFPGSHAYTLEPNPNQFLITKENLKQYEGVEVFPYGAFEKNTSMCFDTRADDPGFASIVANGQERIEVRKLDDLLDGKKVTFIKMDIEGSELAALRGAAQIIRAQRPKLAICIYHKPEDVWEIPQQILSYVPEYTLFLRHYSLTELETVLYAVPPTA